MNTHKELEKELKRQIEESLNGNSLQSVLEKIINEITEKVKSISSKIGSGYKPIEKNASEQIEFIDLLREKMKLKTLREIIASSKEFKERLSIIQFLNRQIGKVEKSIITQQTIIENAITNQKRQEEEKKLMVIREENLKITRRELLIPMIQQLIDIKNELDPHIINNKIKTEIAQKIKRIHTDLDKAISLMQEDKTPWQKKIALIKSIFNGISIDIKLIKENKNPDENILAILENAKLHITQKYSILIGREILNEKKENKIQSAAEKQDKINEHKQQLHDYMESIKNNNNDDDDEHTDNEEPDWENIQNRP